MPKHNTVVPKLDIKPELLDELLNGARTPGEINTIRCSRLTRLIRYAAHD